MVSVNYIPTGLGNWLGKGFSPGKTYSYQTGTILKLLTGSESWCISRDVWGHSWTAWILETLSELIFGRGMVGSLLAVRGMIILEFCLEASNNPPKIYLKSIDAVRQFRFGTGLSFHFDLIHRYCCWFLVWGFLLLVLVLILCFHLKTIVNMYLVRQRLDVLPRARQSFANTVIGLTGRSMVSAELRFPLSGAGSVFLPL